MENTLRKADPRKSNKYITHELINLKEKMREEMYTPSVVISGAWNIPGTLSWYELKGKCNKTNKDLEEIGLKIKTEVEGVTENMIILNWNIISGGALGVDHFATQKVYDLGKLDQLLVILPVKINDYLEHLTETYEGRDVISRAQIEETNGLLVKIYKESPESIYDESIFRKCHEKSYYARNTRQAYIGDSLCAFHVDDTEGTKNMIEEMLGKNKFVYVHRYEVLNSNWTSSYDTHRYNLEKLNLSEGEIEEIFGLSGRRVLIRQSH